MGMRLVIFAILLCYFDPSDQRGTTLPHYREELGLLLVKWRLVEDTKHG